MAEPWTVRRLRAWMVEHFTQRSVESPSLCADLLLAHVLRCDRMRIYMDADRPASPEELSALRELVRRAGGGEPIQYLVGTWSFFGCEIAVDATTLIPRPSTETLVELALAGLRARRVLGASLPKLRIVDLCTGTGCLAIAIARSLRASSAPRRQLAWNAGPADGAASEESALDLRVFATDVSTGATALARRNVSAHGLEGVIEVLDSDLDAGLIGRGLEGACDLITANPPYISDVEWSNVPRNVKEFEPASALRGGVDGLDLVRRIVSCARRWLKSEGQLLVEIGFEQGEAARKLASDAALADISIAQDLEGHDRVLCARAP